MILKYCRWLVGYLKECESFTDVVQLHISYLEIQTILDACQLIRRRVRDYTKSGEFRPGSLRCYYANQHTSKPPELVLVFFTRKSGLRDYTADLEMARCLACPTVTGGLSDIYYAQLEDGTQVAVKCITANGEYKRVKVSLLQSVTRSLNTNS
jgi:hypothetical protein